MATAALCISADSHVVEAPEVFAGVPDEDRYRITAANCCELYGLPFEY